MSFVKFKGNKRSILVALLVFAVVVYFIATFVSLQIKVNAREANKESLQLQYEQQLRSNEELQGYIDSGSEEDYIERIAREEYGYAKPDERVYYDSSAS